MSAPPTDKYEVVIGLEVHTHLRTDSKLFSSAPVRYGDEPNHDVSPIDLAMPGVLPVLQFGTLFLDPNYIQQYAFEIGIGLPFPRVFTIPNNPGLVGLEPQFQALVVDTAAPLDSKLTNDACFVIRS